MIKYPFHIQIRCFKLIPLKNIQKCYFHVWKYLSLVSFSMSSQDIVSEHPERFFVSEIVREKIFMQYRKEIPYVCQVCSWEAQKIWLVRKSTPSLEGKRKRIIIFLVSLLFFLLNFQVNVVSYKTRPTAKDFIQVEIVVEKNSQKIIVIGKVSS